MKTMYRHNPSILNGRALDLAAAAKYALEGASQAKRIEITGWIIHELRSMFDCNIESAAIAAGLAIAAMEKPSGWHIDRQASTSDGLVLSIEGTRVVVSTKQLMTLLKQQQPTLVTAQG